MADLIKILLNLVRAIFRRLTGADNVAARQRIAQYTKVWLENRLMDSLMRESKDFGLPRVLEYEVNVLCREEPEFVLKAAVFAREQMHLRTWPVILLRWLAPHLPSSQMEWAVPRICTRPDQLAELHAYYRATQEKRTLSSGMKKGIRAALAGYSGDQLAKYPKGLARLVKITHPGPSRPEYQALIERRLEAPYTWDELLSKDALGYVDLLDNLPNILQNPSRHIDKVVAKLTDTEAIKRSNLLPYRFLSALRPLERSELPKRAQYKQVMEAVSKAFDISSENLPHLPGVTAFVIEGDLRGPLSLYPGDVLYTGDVRAEDVAQTLMIMGDRMCDSAITIVLGAEAQVIDLPPEGNSLEALAYVRHITTDYIGSWDPAFELLTQMGTEVDRVIILYDTDVHLRPYLNPEPGIPARSGRGRALGKPRRRDQQFSRAWKDRYAPNAWVHRIRLFGSGLMRIEEDKVSMIIGWSDNVLSLIPIIEAGPGALIETIEQYSLSGPVSTVEDKD